MNFRDLKQIKKELQKDRAKKITRAKFISKKKNHHLMTDEERRTYIYKYTDINGSDIFSFNHYRVQKLGEEYRLYHIAYCTFFNKTPYEKIENKCRIKPDFAQIEKIKENWLSELDEEVIRRCA